MKKIPTLFTRVYENHKIVGIKDEITPGCELAFYQGIATIKIDGSCCAVIDGKFYKRYDAKKGKNPPVGAIPCCDHDPVTGHWPHFQGNPYELNNDILVKHGTMVVAVRRDFESISQWLNDNAVEGLVFWLDGEPVCKIKRTDFGYEWPVKEK